MFTFVTEMNVPKMNVVNLCLLHIGLIPIFHLNLYLFTIQKTYLDKVSLLSFSISSRNIPKLISCFYWIKLKCKNHQFCFQSTRCFLYKARFKCQKLGKSLIKNSNRWAVVVVNWTACFPSTLTLWVRILLKSTYSFTLLKIWSNKNKQKKIFLQECFFLSHQFLSEMFFRIFRRNPRIFGILKFFEIQILRINDRSIGRLVAVWPDLTKFRHFAQFLKLFANLLRVYSVLGKISNLLWQTFCQSSNFSVF